MRQKRNNKSENTNPIFFYILIRSWNSFEYFDRCIDSALSQSYKHFKILFVDDASNFDKKQIAYIKSKLKNHTVVFNKVRRYSLLNAYNIIHKYAVKANAVIVNLDADDWFIENNVLAFLSNVYSKSYCLLTYGECLFWDGSGYSKPARFTKEFTNIPYPQNVINDNTYRKYPFLPLHPRTWQVKLFKKIKKSDFLRPDGSWIEFAEDLAIFFPMLELSQGNFQIIKKPLYAYNIASKNNDIKINPRELLKDELIIRKKGSYGNNE